VIKIIPATTIPDFECISKLARIIWHEHYPSLISLEQIDYMLENFNSTDAVKEQVADGVLFYYITYDDEPVGYMAIKKETDYVFIRKLYLLKAYRGKKIAKHALQFIESMAIASDLKAICLYVNKHNTNSVIAYEKMGFFKSKSIVTDIGNGFIMDDYEMTKNINPQ
jgi:ribosomal protein S18 acetylase RimI-like enzyme